MEKAYKFPNGGYEVRIVRRSDIIDAIEKNITDKDVALAIVERCELDCANFLREGRWANIPYIGNIRVPRTKQLLKSDEQQLLIKDAYDNLDTDSYILFKKQLNQYNAQRERFEKSYNYILTIMVNRYNKFYNYLKRNKGDYRARITVYTLGSLDPLTEDFKVYHGYD